MIPKGQIDSSICAQDKAESLGIASLTQTHIEKLSGDNTREEKDRVMGALRTGYILFFLNYIVIISICRSLNWHHNKHRECRLLISTKCAGMGCDIPDIRVTVCIGKGCSHITSAGVGLWGDAWQKCTGQKCTKHQLVLLNIFKFSGSKNANKS